MNLNLRTAPTSLIVSWANLFVTGLALLLGFSSRYGEWAVVLFMVFLPPLIAAVFLSLRDIWRPATREAVLALLICLPALVAEGWFYNWGRGW